jgi:hypothetical protein
MTSSTQQPYLGRCKQCDYALFATPEDVKEGNNARAGGPPVNVGNGQIMGRCTNGHRWFSLKRIKGTYSKDHKCDSRCLNAKGHDCTCSCGGANHGRGHAVQVVEANTLTVTQADDATEKQVALIRRLLDERVIPDDEANGVIGIDRKDAATRMLDAGEFTKRQASKTIEWLFTLPRTWEV